MYIHLDEKSLNLYIGTDEDELELTAEQVIEQIAYSIDIDFAGLKNEGAPVYLGNSYAEYQFTLTTGENKHEILYGLGPNEVKELNERGYATVRPYLPDDLAPTSETTKNIERVRGEGEVIDEPDTIRNELTDSGLLRGDAAINYPHPSEFEIESTQPYPIAENYDEAYVWRSSDDEYYIKAINHGNGAWSFESNLSPEELEKRQTVAYGNDFESAYERNFNLTAGLFASEGKDMGISNPLDPSKPFNNLAELKSSEGMLSPSPRPMKAKKEKAGGEARVQMKEENTRRTR